VEYVNCQERNSEIRTEFGLWNAKGKDFAGCVVFLSEIAKWVKPSGELKVLKDEPDNRILECAVAGKADLIVTGDKEMLRLGIHGRTRIVGLNTYLRDWHPGTQQ
jgi:predicted nucleic acid-binding protein